jgi:arginyl-tRNA synthetase
VKEEVQNTLIQAYQAWAKDQNSGFDPSGFPVSVDLPPSNIPGDLASSLPLSLAKKVQRPPRLVAQEMIDRLPLEGPVERAEIAGPGFLNFFLSVPWLTAELRAILEKRDHYAHKPAAGEGPVLIEFVSANPTGPLHVGHGRGAALGDSLARILRHLGHDVKTEYYINDVGNQMENLGASVMKRCEELRPGYLDEAEKAFLNGRKPEDLYKGDYVVPIAQEILSRYPDPSQRAHGVDFFRQAGIEHILNGIQRDLADFQVSLESWFPESSLYKENWVDKALARLQEQGYLKEEEGALWFRSTAFGDDKDRVLKRRDERPTYFASDIAYHANKFQRGFRRLIDIWGTDHHGYVPRLKAVVQALGQDPEKLTILLYQLVSLVRAGKPVAMSTRSGEFVTLREVMDEVGKDACRFFFAMRSPNSHLEFDLDLAKKQAPENPVFYIQYVHARCCSIFREAEKRGISTQSSASFPSPSRLEPPERALLVKLASYPDAVDQCRRDLSPHHLTVYLLALAREFHSFYENCRVLGEPLDITAFRLALVDGVRTLIRNGLSLLGIRAPETM